jgi:excisionase family DNA binding protein
MLLFVCMNSLISTKEAAARLRISVRRVQALIASGRLPAEKIGNSFAIKESDLKSLNGRKNGRPVNGTKPKEKDWGPILDQFIGCLKDLPPDLSTNPKYMEGFGRDK